MLAPAIFDVLWVWGPQILTCLGFGARLVLVLGWGGVGVDRIVVTPACLKFLRGPAVHGSIFICMRILSAYLVNLLGTFTKFTK